MKIEVNMGTEDQVRAVSTHDFEEFEINETGERFRFFHTGQTERIED